jgi:hypothetical protein
MACYELRLAETRQIASSTDAPAGLLARILRGMLTQGTAATHAPKTAQTLGGTSELRERSNP